MLKTNARYLDCQELCTRLLYSHIPPIFPFSSTKVMYTSWHHKILHPFVHAAGIETTDLSSHAQSAVEELGPAHPLSVRQPHVEIQAHGVVQPVVHP